MAAEEKPIIARLTELDKYRKFMSKRGKCIQPGVYFGEEVQLLQFAHLAGSLCAMFCVSGMSRIKFVLPVDSNFDKRIEFSDVSDMESLMSLIEGDEAELLNLMESEA